MEERDIQFGLIYRCRVWDDHGIISSDFGEKVFYFDKQQRYIMPDCTLVAFVVSKSDSSKAEHVTEITIKNSSSVYYLSKKDIHEDGEYCGELLNNLRQIRIPILVDIDSLKHIALVSENDESLFFYTHPLTSFQKYALNIYRYLISIKPFTGIDLYELSTELSELKKYISEFDEDKVINSYKIHKYGYLQNRVGRDDHFHYGTEKTIDSDDPYIKSILPVGEERAYEATNSYEEGYDLYEEEKAKKCIEEAKELYDRNTHLAYLLKLFLDEYYNNNEDREYDYLNQSIRELFGIDKVSSYRHWGDDYIFSVHYYNNRNNH